MQKHMDNSPAYTRESNLNLWILFADLQDYLL